jgi:UDP-glucose 4-epimerase
MRSTRLTRALLTGGAGFIGSHLAKSLVAHGFSVDCVDNLSTGEWDNVSSLVQNPNFRFHLGSADDATLMEPLVQKAEVVYHMAASVGVKNIMQNTIHSIENNIFSTSLMLRLSDKFKKRVFIFSTSEVYGKTNKFPFNEEDDIVFGPASKLRWGYAASKLLDDYLASAYFVENNTRVTMVRLFNTIGTGQVGHYGMVVPRFFDQARANQDITVYGDGRQTRCFTDVRDVIEILRLLIENEQSIGKLINIGSTEEISILDLAQKIKVVTGSRSEIQLIPFEQVYGPHFEDMGRRVPNLARLQSIMGYRLRYTLDDTLNWIEEYARNANEVVPEMRSALHGTPIPENVRNS